MDPGSLSITQALHQSKALIPETHLMYGGLCSSRNCIEDWSNINRTTPTKHAELMFFGHLPIQNHKTSNKHCKVTKQTNKTIVAGTKASKKHWKVTNKNKKKHSFCRLQPPATA